MKAIFKREFKSYFTSPIGYTVLGIFFLISGFFYWALFNSGQSDLTNMFSTMFIIVLVVIPILTMRIFTEDKRQKTEQLLNTSPVSLTAIVMGKFFAALAVFGIGVGITVIYQIIIAFFTAPDWMVFIGNLIGILLLGSAFISVGMLISSLTESQVVAAIISFAISIFLYLMDSLASITGVDAIKKIVSYISINERYTEFSVGILNYAGIIFFVSFTAIFLFITIRALDSKRYA